MKHKTSLKIVELLKPCLHWRKLPNNTSNSDTHYLLTLATLGGMTEIKMILIAKVSKEDDIAMPYHRHFHVQILPM